MILTPKEKASELIVNYQLQCKSLDYQQAKQCGLIAVDEILKIVNIWSALNMQKSSQVIFWEEVREEIEKL